jgi:hypothetical protein
MNETNKEINYSTIQPDSFSFAKSRDLKHIKASEMKVVKGKMVKETACGRNLVIPNEYTNQIKETNKEVNVNNHLSKFCLKCFVAIGVLEFAGREKEINEYSEGYEIYDRYIFLKKVAITKGKEKEIFEVGDKW